MYCVFICLPAACRAAAASPGQPTVAKQSLRIGWTEMSSARPPRRRPRGGEAAAVGCGANRGAAVDVGMQSYASRGGAAVAHGGAHVRRCGDAIIREKSDRMPRNKTGRRAFTDTAARRAAADDQLPEPARKSASFPDTNVVFKKQSLSILALHTIDLFCLACLAETLHY